TEEPKPLSDFRNDVPAALVAVLQRMMNKRPDDRFQTPAAVVQALSAWEQAQTDSSVLPETVDLVRSATHVPRRRRWAVVGAMLIIGLVCLAALPFIFQRRPHTPEKKPDVPGPEVVTTVTQQEPESPLDNLDRATIPRSELFEWQPEGLVALLGLHNN